MGAVHPPLLYLLFGSQLERWFAPSSVAFALGADSTTKQLPGPFKALPRLLRDDALAHLKREYKGTVTLPSSNPT